MPEVVEESGLSFVVYEKESADDATFNIPFPYLEKEHVYLNIAGSPYTYSTHYTVTNATLTIDAAVFAAISDGDLIKIYRKTPYTELIREFADGTVLTEDEIQTVNLQLLYILQEFLEAAGLDLSTGNTGTPGTGNVTGYHEIGISNTNGNVSTSEFTGVPANFYSTNTLVFHNGVLLEPGDDYSLVGGPVNSVLTLRDPTTGLASANRTSDGDRIILWRLGADATVTTQLAANSVFSSAIQPGAVTLDKLVSIGAFSGQIKPLFYNNAGNVTAGPLDYTNINNFAVGVRTVNIATLDMPAIGSIDLGGYNLTSVADPTVDQDAATKKYVDDSIAGVGFAPIFRTFSPGTATEVFSGTLAAGKYIVMAKQAGASTNYIRIFPTGLPGSAVLDESVNLGAGETIWWYFTIPSDGSYSIDNSGTAFQKPDGCIFKVGN